MDHLSSSVDVVRALGAAPQFRAAADGGLGTLFGHFSTFDTWYEVSSRWEGDFLERVSPGGFTQTITEDRAGMRVLFDHGFDPQLGNKVLGPIRSLAEDGTGAAYEVPLFDTSYNRDLMPGLKAGVYGASFRMRVMDDAWVDKPARSAYNPAGLPERTISRAKVFEFGPVTFPASPSASAGIRSATDQFYEQLARRDQHAYADAVRAAGRRVPGLVTRMTDATPQELVAAADTVIDQLEIVHDAGDHEGTMALITALDEIIDGLMTAMGMPDADEMAPDAMPAKGMPAKGAGAKAPMAPMAMASGRPRSAAPTDFVSPGARSAGRGGKDGEPGNGEQSHVMASRRAVRDRMLKMKGII